MVEKVAEGREERREEDAGVVEGANVVEKVEEAREARRAATTHPAERFMRDSAACRLMIARPSSPPRFGAFFILTQIQARASRLPRSGMQQLRRAR